MAFEPLHVCAARWTLLLASLGGCSLVGVEGLQDGSGGSGATSASGATSTSASTGTSPSAGGSSASSAGGDGSGGSGGDAPSSACPDDMVLAEDEALGAAFCIDRTETTQTDYIAFLVAVGDAEGVAQPSECEFNTELTDQTSACPDFTTGSDLPVFCVDWCDARAYCDWAGKRLCGALGGGNMEGLEAPLVREEWNFACTGGLVSRFPYGDEPQVGACNIPQENTPEDPSDDNARAPVGSFPGCEGGFDGLFDMQGNVMEWVDWCEPAEDGQGESICRARGGHTYGTAEYWDCENLDPVLRRNQTELELGIRCCKDATL